MASKYEKFSHLEHILARPDTYVGSLQEDTTIQWVMEGEVMKERPIKNVPALFKIFDEILVNAVDQCTDTTNMVTKIHVNVSDDTIEISNTGIGIAIEKHEKYNNQWVPEMIFGELLTSSNYNDAEKRTTGGRNGYGAKLANVFSKEFSIDIASTFSKKRYQQTWTNNMSNKKEPKVTSYSNKLGYTKVSFKPDLPRFKMTSLNTDIRKLFERRTYDICVCTPKNVKVYFNNSLLVCNTFEKYVSYYIGEKSSTERVHSSTPRWEICVAPSSNGFKHVSFVNGINTYLGGSHVDSVVNNLVKKVIDYTTTKHKDVKIKPQHVKENIIVFVNCTLVNPSFSSQTKTECTSRYKDFGSSFEFSEDSLKKIYKMQFIQEVLALAKHKEMRDLKKTDGKKTHSVRGIPKLEDANKAGTNKSNECTLILTEGDSAKTFAISGLSVVGRDTYGVFPLKGKLLNVREATVKQLANNEEINNIKKILGLQNDTVYKSSNELRYGRVMILTDADVDGSHIKGLFMNFIHHFWPSLMNLDSFITSLRTPILKVSKAAQTLSFYNQQDYITWKDSQGNLSKNWSIKYYKGLGTSTAAEARGYFSNLKETLLTYKHDDDGAIDLAFKKTLSDARKVWIKEGTISKQTLDHKQNTITTSDFVNLDLRWFSIADNKRSIPSVMDGLKPSQRKVLFACRKRSGNSEIKISQLAGIVSSETCYHHGEQSLMATIIGMAQNYVGSNNINLLEPKGQFGTRLMGGKDAASPRYIFTQLTSKVESLFHEDDDPILEYEEDDGTQVEPVYFVPTMPLILVNGCEGIGTGYSTSIPCYNPKDVVENLRRLLNNENQLEMKPWYNGFLGSIEQISTQKFMTRGVWKLDKTKLTITELPIGKWTSDYKEFLEQLQDENKINMFENHSSENSPHFVVHLNATDVPDIDSFFKLTSTLNTTNMHCFDETGVIRKFESPNDIISLFAQEKLKTIEKRKNHKVQSWESQLTHLLTQIRFMELVMDEKIKIFKQTKEYIHQQLKSHGFNVLNYETLLSIRLDAFTLENIETKKTFVNKLQVKKENYEAMSTSDLWRLDLK